MSDNKNEKDFRDRERINLTEKYEVAYWTKKFGVSADELDKAVKDVGPMVKDVEASLKGKL